MKLNLNTHSLKKGNKIEIPINNGFWKVFYHWIVQKNLRRKNVYTVSGYTNTEIEIE